MLSILKKVMPCERTGLVVIKAVIKAGLRWCKVYSEGVNNRESLEKGRQLWGLW